MDGEKVCLLFYIDNKYCNYIGT